MMTPTQSPQQFLQEYWQSRIQRDMAPFIDPGSELSLEIIGRAINARWLQRGKDRQASFLVSVEKGIEVQCESINSNYGSFFAGASMGDLLGLAKTTLLSSQPKSTSSLSKQQVYVQTKARLADSDSPENRPATDLLRHTVDNSRDSNATTVIMVKGEAGAGKTSALRRLVIEQADLYAKGQVKSLLLYVNAQGRALARFHEALATELQDLRANLTYHGVSTLVRLGLLVPVIDGFDELLGVGGYDDAFSSLAQFIEELDGEGCIIASARSTYYEQEFVTRANRVSSLGSQVWRQVPVEVLAWGDDEVNDYVTKLADSSMPLAELREKTDKAFRGQNAPLRTKPLFVARTVDLILGNADFSVDGDLLVQVVAGYIERERTEKLLNRSGGSLLTSEQIKSLLADVAEEMWNQETRELDRRSAQELAELALMDSGLDDDGKTVVARRMPDLAFLMPGEKSGSIAFEHETFFYHFLASRFALKLVSKNGISALMLGRSVLASELAENIWKEVLLVSAVPPAIDVIDKLCATCISSSLRTTQVRENAGIIVSCVLQSECRRNPHKAISNLSLNHLIFPGGSLADVALERAILREIEFRRTDLSKTKICNSFGNQLRFFEVLIDSAVTRLEITGLDSASDFIGLRIVEGANIKVAYDPQVAHQALVSVGAAAPLPSDEDVYRRVDQTVQTLLERFLRAYNRVNPVCKADDKLRHVFTDPNWGRLQELLEDSGVVSSEARSTGGARKQFLRRQVLPSEVMQGARKDAKVPPQVGKLWQALEVEFPSKG